jgi:anti-sigma B factor antagonist
MEFRTRQRDGVTIADLSGRLAVGGGDIVFREGTRALLDRGVRSLVLNLEGLDLMDSSGLGELVAARRAAQAVGTQIALVHVGKVIQQTMQGAGLLGAFPIYDDETRAVASFRR